MCPPITPNGPTGTPSRVRNPGMIVWNGRLPGPTALGWSGSSRNPTPRLCSPNPNPGSTTYDPKPM
jgi:hypothetical protein